MSPTPKERPAKQKRESKPPAAAKSVMVRLPESLKTKLETKARSLGMTQGQLQARALEYWFEQEGSENLVSRQLYELRLGVRRIESRQKILLEVLLGGLRVLFSLRGSVPDEAQEEHNNEGKRRYEALIKRMIKREAENQTGLAEQLEKALFVSQDREGAHQKENQ